MITIYQSTPFATRQRAFALVVWLLLIPFTTSCNTDAPSQQIPEVTDDTVTAETFDTPTFSIFPNNLLGFVTDLDGNLIPFASLGGAVAGSSGVITDAVEPTDGGWYIVEAPGYTTTYTQPVGTMNGITIFNVMLTPVGTMASHSINGETIELSLGSEEAPIMTIHLDPQDFREDAIVEITALTPGSLDTTYAPMDTTDTLFIVQPFEIQAYAAGSGQVLQPASGEQIEVTLNDGGLLGDPPRLFLFDPDQGMWIEELDVCERTNPDQISCQLDHLSQFGGAGSSPPPPSSGGSDHANASEKTKTKIDNAARDIAERIKSGEEIPSDCEIFTPAVVEAFMQEVESALREAENRPSEAVKAKLAATAARLQYWGGFNGDYESGCPVFPEDWAHSPDPYADLLDAINEVTEKLAEDVLKDPQCPDIDRLRSVLAEAYYYSVDSVIPSLESTHQDLLEQCNLWEGRIEYSIVMPPTATYDGFYDWHSGARYWTEVHEISIVLNTSSEAEAEDFGTFDGYADVTTNFPPVVYRRDIQAPCSFPVFNTRTLSGIPNPGGIRVTFTGQFEPESGFSPGDPTATNTIDLDSQIFETGFTATPGCAKDVDIEGTFSNPYQGQVVEQVIFAETGEGLAFISTSPGSFGKQFSTLWEILNQGPTSSSPSSGQGSYPREFYSGDKVLDAAGYIFSLDEARVIMRWNIVHTDYTKGR